MNLLEILGRIGFDWQVALANLVNFLIIFWLLKKFVFSPMKSTIKEREERIDRGIKNAQEAEEKLREALNEKEEILSEARKEAHSIVAKARDEEARIVKEAEVQAEIKAQKILDKGRESLDRKEEEMERELKKRASDLIIRGVEKILSEELSGDKAKKYEKEMSEGMI